MYQKCIPIVYRIECTYVYIYTYVRACPKRGGQEFLWQIVDNCWGGGLGVSLTRLNLLGFARWHTFEPMAISQGYIGAVD